jgi:GAF domain-containing protein
MSVISRASLVDGAQAREVSRAGAPLRGAAGTAQPVVMPTTMHVQWEIGTSALLGSNVARGLIDAAGVRSSEIAWAALVWEIKVLGDGRARACAMLVLELRDERRIAVPLVAGVDATCAIDGRAAMMSADGSGVSVVVRVDRATGARLVYARTDLLEVALGLSGGVYDAPSLAGAGY